MKAKKLTGYPSVDKLHQRGKRITARHPLIPNISIYQAFRLLSISFRSDIAIDCHDVTITFQELLNTADRLSHSFEALGVTSKDIITVCMPNLPQAIAIFFAANRIGATVTFLSEAAPPNEVRYYLRLYHSSLLFNYNKDSRYNQALVRQTSTKYVITVYANERDRYLNNKSFMDYNWFLSLASKQNKSYKNPFRWKTKCANSIYQWHNWQPQICRAY